jgi:crotonobetainyl-CoA:carnitine CoA-transferase CaiB-like acyl-CoA transferase
MPGALEGLRVVDCTRGNAGPRATGFLADYGASVIRVEPPGGDPWAEALRTDYSVFNRAKQTVQLDLKSDGKEQLLELLEAADVFVQSWRPGVAEDLGVGYASLHDRYPSLVYGSISGFGNLGDERGVRGYEATVHALMGTMAEQVGLRDGPIFEGAPFASVGAAHMLNIGLLAALYRRFDDGHGRHVETSLIDGALAFHAMLWGDTTASPNPEKGKADDLAPTGSTARLICGSFLCSDDRYIGVHTGAVGAFGRLMKLIGLDDRIPPSESGIDMGVLLSAEDQVLLHTEIHRVFATQPLEVWVERLLEADICGIPQLRPTEVFDEPQPRLNGMVIEVDDAVLGRIEQVAPPARFSVSTDYFDGTRTPSESDTFGGDRWLTPEPTDTPDVRAPLDGIHVLDFGAFYAGPYASRMLADLGADVIKVETIAGDPMRGMVGLFNSAQAGKRSVAIDLKDPEVKPILAKLLAWADIVGHNMRPGAAERAGVGYANAVEVNPTILYSYSPGWGSSGPYSLRQSFEPMMSGYVGVGFEVAGEYNPPLYPAGNADPGNGLVGACSMLMGLLHRRRTGEGQYFENPQLNATMVQLAHIVRRLPDKAILGAGRLDALQTGFGPLERLYETEDGWICIVAKTEEEVRVLGEHLGIDDLVKRVFVDGPSDPDSSYELAQLLGDAFLAQSTAALLAELAPDGLAVVEPRPHHNLTFLRDPANLESGRVGEVVDPKRGAIRELATLVTVSDSERTPHRMAPSHGRDSAAVLRELGCDSNLIRSLVERGALRDGG